MSLVDHALSHLGTDEGNAGQFDELLEHVARALSIRARTDEEQWVSRFFDHLDCGGHGLGFRGGSARRPGFEEKGLVHLFFGDVLGQFEMDRPGSFFFGETNRFTNRRRNIGAVNDLARVFRDRSHHFDDIDDLEAGLFTFLDRLLAGDHQHRHRAQLCIGRSGHEIRRTRPECGQADAALSGESSDRGGHEARALFMAGDDELDLRVPKTFEQIQIFFAGNSKDVLDTLAFERLDH